MPESQRPPAVTRIAQLELRDEQRLVKAGYELLDEKRIRLVAEIRAQLARLRRWQSEVRKGDAAVRSSLAAALGRHGLEELSVYPAASAADDELGFTHTQIFGLGLLEARWQRGAARSTARPVNPSPEARTCAQDYRALLEPLLHAAVHGVNLRRLIREYLLTERRARAVENVVLPEIERSLKFLDEQLEILDQEEVARVRRHTARARLS